MNRLFFLISRGFPYAGWRSVISDGLEYWFKISLSIQGVPSGARDGHDDIVTVMISNGATNWNDGLWWLP